MSFDYFDLENESILYDSIIYNLYVAHFARKIHSSIHICCFGLD